MIEASEQALAFVAGRVRANLDSDAMLHLALMRAVERTRRQKRSGYRGIGALAWIHCLCPSLHSPEANRPRVERRMS